MISIFVLCDVIFNYYFSTIFTLSYIISISYLVKYRFKKYIYIILVVGLLYDLIFTDILFLNSLIFYLIFLLIRKTRKYNIFILGMLSIMIYYLLTLLFTNFNYQGSMYFLNYIIINYVVFLLTYFITKRIYNTR